MAYVKCHGGASLWRFLPLPNLPVAVRKGIRAKKRLMKSPGFKVASTTFGVWHVLHSLVRKTR